MALVFAPRRRDTLGVFCRLAQEAGLSVSQHQQYDSQVWDVHLKVRGWGLGGVGRATAKDIAHPFK